ncbi:elongation factor Ts [Candidatus Parcubacteria bacterium]|nr:elongation factor Ts [Candidatus Parcubacteria bacterium]
MEKIKKLRTQTGAGMVDCKKALDEANGDIEKATEILRKKGIAKAAKRGEREAAEGVIKAAVSDDKREGYILEINAETDFVVRNEKFQDFSDKVLQIIKDKKPSNLDELFSLEMDGATVKETLDNLSGTIGEKINISRFDILSGATVANYSHSNGRIGVLLSLDSASKNELAYDLAMHTAAADPRYLKPEDVGIEEINKEKEIYREQLKKEGKPEQIIDKILAGKINKFYEEVCLLNQEYIKDDKKKVLEILEGANIEKYIRYSL